MSLTPVEVRHLELRGGLFGYRRAGVRKAMDDIADSFESVWRERAELIERVEVLETELQRHAELENLLRSTLVSAERASQDVRDNARRESEVIVAEANAEARRILREAISEKEQLLGEVRKIRALLRSALDVVEVGAEAPAEPPQTTGETAPPQGVAPESDDMTAVTTAGVRRIAG